MTNYEKICAYINAGHYAVCLESDMIRIFTSLVDGGARYGYGTSMETAIHDLGHNPETISWINKKVFSEIYPLPRPIPKYKVGDKVVVLENTKELLRNTSIVAGGIYTVSAVNSNGTIHLDNCIVSFLPHCVAPYFDDDIEEMTVEQICKALGKNIKIVK